MYATQWWSGPESGLCVFVKSCLGLKLPSMKRVGAHNSLYVHSLRIYTQTHTNLRTPALYQIYSITLHTHSHTHTHTGFGSSAMRAERMLGWHSYMIVCAEFLVFDRQLISGVRLLCTLIPIYISTCCTCASCMCVRLYIDMFAMSIYLKRLMWITHNTMVSLLWYNHHAHWDHTYSLSLLFAASGYSI